MLISDQHKKLKGFGSLIEAETGIQMLSKLSDSVEYPVFEFWFHEFSYREGPVFKLRAEGLHRHLVEIYVGDRSSPLIRQIENAGPEQKRNACVFLDLLKKRGFTIETDQISVGIINLNESSKVLSFTKHKLTDHLSEETFRSTISAAVSPSVLAIAELIGFEESGLTEYQASEENELEGSVTLATVKKRERSARNRMLCIAYHGPRCCVCGFDSKSHYGPEVQIIEVHHVQPLSSLEAPRPFDPITDLVPLCPNCHRAIHSKRPIPLTPNELRDVIEKNDIHS